MIIRILCSLLLMLFSYSIGMASDSSSIGEKGFSIYFVGDSGDLNPLIEKAFQQELNKNKNESLIIFLGDNIYPAGLRPVNEIQRIFDEQVLKRQLDLIKIPNKQALFIPGNHDWGLFGPSDFSVDGINRILEQQEFINIYLRNSAFQPLHGCPGPVVTYFRGIRIISIDSQWLLYDKDKSQIPARCVKSNQEFYRKLQEVSVSETPATYTIFVSHHPLRSYGKHSEHSGLTCNQEMLCPAYIRMLKMIKSVLKYTAPFICAAGHDHSLQVAHGDSACKHYLVSGAMSNVNKIQPNPNLDFALERLGLFRVDFLKTEKPRLNVLSLDSDGNLGSVFKQFLN